MNIKAKSHLKHINIKIYSKKKIIKKNCSFPKHPKTAKCFLDRVEYWNIFQAFRLKRHRIDYFVIYWAHAAHEAKVITSLHKNK